MGNRRCALMEGLLLVVCFLLTVRRGSADPRPCSLDPLNGLECPPDPRMKPTVEQFRGQDYLWQIPENPKAVLFLAHGGTELPHWFFDSGPTCPMCYSLPEERLVVLDALDRNYAVIAPKSVGAAWEKWPPETSEDLDIAHDLVLEWTRNHSLEGLPLFSMGHSSGGGFAAVMPSRLPIRGVVPMCSGGERHMFGSIAPGGYPPVLFVSFNFSTAVEGDDSTTVEEIMHSVGLLQAKGIPTTVRWCGKKKFSAAFLKRRIRCMSDEMAERAYATLAMEGWFDEDGYLTQNPQFGNWVYLLKKWKSVPLCDDVPSSLFLQPDIREELGTAYGVHSFTSEANDDIFDFLDSLVTAEEEVGSPYLSASR